MAPRKNQGRNRKAKKALSKKVVNKMQDETDNSSNTNVNETSVEQNTAATSATPEVPVVEEQSGGSSVSVESSAPVLTPESKSKKSKAKPKKLVKPKTSVSVSEPVNESEVQTELATVTETVTETATVSQVGSGKQVRSFKVRLPGNDSFEGRFTGLTPYQAANKALSKYYRETDKPKKQIQFTIRESTRGSKRSLYTYNGRREKLKIPVEYAIKDGRTITKNYKNRLTKVKKAELASLTV